MNLIMMRLCVHLLYLANFISSEFRCNIAKKHAAVFTTDENTQCQ